MTFHRTFFPIFLATLLSSFLCTSLAQATSMGTAVKGTSTSVTLKSGLCTSVTVSSGATGNVAVPTNDQTGPGTGTCGSGGTAGGGTEFDCFFNNKPATVTAVTAAATCPSTPTFVQGKNVLSGSSSPSITMTGVAAGDAIAFLLVDGNSNGSISTAKVDGTTITFVSSTDHVNAQASGYGYVTGLTAGSHTLALTGTFSSTAGISMVEVAHANATFIDGAFVNGYDTAGATTTNSFTLHTITTTVANDLVIAAGWNNVSGANDLTTGTAWTSYATSPVSSYYFEYGYAATAGAVIPAWTCSDASNYRSGIAIAIQ